MSAKASKRHHRRLERLRREQNARKGWLVLWAVLAAFLAACLAFALK